LIILLTGRSKSFPIISAIKVQEFFLFFIGITFFSGRITTGWNFYQQYTNRYKSTNNWDGLG